MSLFEHDIGWGHYEPITRRFAQFLERADKYVSLPYESNTHASVPQVVSKKPKIILVEDLPNVANHITKTAIHNAIRKYATSSRSQFPIVFIITEVACIGGDSGNTGFRASDERKLTLKDVIPSDVMTMGCVREIKFNSVAPTLVKKCLTRVCDVVFRTGTQKLIRPSLAELEWISKTCNGDIRCAINNLQFSSLREPEWVGADHHGHQSARNGLVNKSRANRKKPDEAERIK